MCLQCIITNTNKLCTRTKCIFVRVLWVFTCAKKYIQFYLYYYLGRMYVHGCFFRHIQPEALQISAYIVTKKEKNYQNTPKMAVYIIFKRLNETGATNTRARIVPGGETRFQRNTTRSIRLYTFGCGLPKILIKPLYAELVYTSSHNVHDISK